MSHRVAQLLRRFQLPPQASLPELREAYLKQAKVLHPDVAGKSSEDQFRQLKEDYEEAMRLLRKGPSSSAGSPRASPSATYRAQSYQAYQAGAQFYGGSAYHDYHQGFTWQSPPNSGAGASSGNAAREAAEPQTAAQRLRNVLLVAGGVLAVTLFAARRTTQRDSLAARLDPASAVDAAVASAAVASIRPDKRPPVIQPVSDYYKKRTSKSTVRVRSTDQYVSPVETPKSRAAEEGLGSSAAMVGSMARGCSPSEARDEKAPDARG